MPSMTYLFSEDEAPSIERPPVLNSMLAPGACAARVVKSRPLGRFSMNSSRMFVARVVVETSTMGASPVTVTSSWIVLTRSAMSTFRVWPSERRTSVRLTDVKPVRLEETS
jgi:hypothetical protein